MGLSHLIRHALNLSPRAAIAKGGEYSYRIAKAYVHQALISRRSTYSVLASKDKDRAEWPDHDFGAINERLLSPLSKDLLQYADNGAEHCFNLLGSGLVKVEYGLRAAGFEGHEYPVHTIQKTAEQIVARVSPGNKSRAGAIRDLIDKKYSPIDWQIDFKSGYRWSENTVSKALPYGHEPGVDIKVPWELARFQHLPGLALAYQLNRQAGYEREFRNQVLDFASANPPGFGVNWICAMDVAIRAANLVFAMDLFTGFEACFDEAFLDEFQALIMAHGEHVFNNLEWHDLYRGNHYLADIAGLLFIAAYLPSEQKTDHWLVFAIEQLINEIERQFTHDGANFEASTSYHRLSMEMAIFTTALVLGLDEEKLQVLKTAGVEIYPVPGGYGDSPFPPWYFVRLEKMAEFSMHITKPNGRIVQIGDNDCGRFIVLCPLSNDEGLDHRSSVGAVNGLFRRSDFSRFACQQGKLASAIVSTLAKERKVESYFKEGEQPGAINRFSDSRANLSDELNILAETVIKLPDKAVLNSLESISYPDFGLYIWRSPDFFLSVRCGPIGQNGNGGHAHNDQLAIELNISGEDWVADPGSFLYTPSTKQRDIYRSVHAHAAPRIGNEEPARLDLGLFRLEDRAKAKCSYFNTLEFEGLHNGYGFPIRRRIIIHEDRIRVVDDTPSSGNGVKTGQPAVIINTPQALREHYSLTVAFSPGYGLLE